MAALFKDRADAGRQLAQALTDAYANIDRVQVLALPRGGVPVAYEVARALNAPLDVLVVRKLGVPSQPELAMGAIASGGVITLNDDIIDQLGISADQINAVAQAENRELERRENQYRQGRATTPVQDCTVIVIDDGLATGATMRAAVTSLRSRKPARIIAAVPVAAVQTLDELRQHADDVVCLATPSPFQAVGLWYRAFPQTSDQEVQALLQKIQAF